MRTTFKISLLAALAICSLQFKAFAQDTQTDNHQITVVIPNIALLDLETSVAKNFTATYVQPTPLEAGEKINTPANNTDLWLNYSSIIPTTVTSRRVDVKASATVAGTNITVVAAAATTGAGTRGTPASTVTLTTSDQAVITGIGSAYTVTGASNGHRLTYAFSAADGDYANLRAGSATVTVTYTLVDN